MRPRSWSASVAILLVLLGTLSGCATSRSDLWRQHFGIRPDEPSITGKPKSCDEYTLYYSNYAQPLQEAYHARATQNRLWIYVAGILGLGVAAASGGLAAATAVSAGTLGLLSISGGFSVATFATIDNSDLAQIYTIAANRVDAALKESNNILQGDKDGNRYTNLAACDQALRVLRDGVSEARTTLEQSRTNTAVAALVRATEQQRVLNNLIAGVQAADPTRVTLPADITDLNPASPEKDPAGKSKPTQVELTVQNIRLDQVAQADVKILFGPRELSLDAPAQPGPDSTTYKVKFTAPPDPPDAARKEYAPVLLVGKTKQRVVSQQGKKFTYP